MDDERILGNAVLRLDKAPKGRGLRVHENADWLTADILRALNEHGWIEWRLWVQTEHGPTLQLKDGSWTSAKADWEGLLAEFTGDISPEIRLTRYKGRNHAAELRLASRDHSKNGGDTTGSKFRHALVRLHEHYVAPTMVGIVLLVIVGLAIWKWPWIKEFVG